MPDFVTIAPVFDTRGSAERATIVVDLSGADPNPGQSLIDYMWETIDFAAYEGFQSIGTHVAYSDMDVTIEHAALSSFRVTAPVMLVAAIGNMIEGH